jgi:hypothetical protein
MYIAQEHPLGRQGLSDFTEAGELGVTIAGVPFAHRLVSVCARAGARVAWSSAIGNVNAPGLR